MINIKVKNPKVYNKIIELITRFFVKNILGKNDINNINLNKLYNNIFAFSVYFIYIENNFSYDFNNETYNDAYNILKKFVSVLVIKGVITNNINNNFIVNILIPMIIGYLFYALVILNILKKFDIDNVIQSIIMNIIDTVVIDLINNESIDIKINDLLGRYIYDKFVKDKILFS